MNEKGKTAIILGATGLTGSILLELLLTDPRYKKIKLFSRSSVEFEHPKMEEFLGDLLNLSRFKKDFQGDEVFCCIGTTRSKTPEKGGYREIDHGIPVEAAALAVENGIESILVISSMGANPESRIFYNRTKGQMEKDVRQQGVPRTFFLRPSLIAGKRQEKRLTEQVAGQFMKVLDLVLVGPLDKFRSIDPGSIARCMIWLANNPYDKTVIPSDTIRYLGGKYTY